MEGSTSKLEKPVVIMLVGPPGCGKTKKAKKLVERGYVRTNRDDLRMSMFGAYSGLTKKQEDLITEVQIRAVHTAMGQRKDIVIDDTNLNWNTQRMWARMIEDFCTHDLEFFVTTTPLKKCIERNRGREKFVPEYVIERMFKSLARPEVICPDIPIEWVMDEDMDWQYAEKNGKVKNVQRYENNWDLPSTYVFDIDGTLSLNTSGRSFYEYSRVKEDSEAGMVASLLRNLYVSGFKIVLASGRKEDSRKVTSEWLEDHHIYYDKLILREDDDNRPDGEVKMEMLYRQIAPFYCVVGWFDDRITVSREIAKSGVQLYRVCNPDWVF